MIMSFRVLKLEKTATFHNYIINLKIHYIIYYTKQIEIMIISFCAQKIEKVLLYSIT